MKEAFDAVTEETAKAYYDEHPQEFTQPAGRLASHILVRVTESMDETAKMDRRAKAEGIRKALLEGADFAKLAAEASDCMSRLRGGVLGVIPRGREAPAFEEAVYSQAFDKIGEVVESPVGFHVVQVNGEQEELKVSFDEVKDRLIVSLKNQSQQKITFEYIEELKSRATIKLDGALAESVAEAKATAPAEAAAQTGAVTAPPAEAPVTAP
jgi:peptidyl-prolyl cis-trans isomerase C